MTHEGHLKSDHQHQGWPALEYHWANKKTPTIRPNNVALVMLMTDFLTLDIAITPPINNVAQLTHHLTLDILLTKPIN